MTYTISIWKEDNTSSIITPIDKKEAKKLKEADKKLPKWVKDLTWIDAPNRIIGGIELRIEENKVHIRKFKIKTVNKSFDKEEEVIERSEIIEYLTKWINNLRKRNKKNIQYSYACSRKEGTIKFKHMLEILSN